MASGTLVPFMNEIALPGDTFDIDLSCDVKTLPTLGPLFGSYKIQLDVFECPIRLYQGKLHMNMLGVGMDMKSIKLPQLRLVNDYDPETVNDNSQISPSSIYSYLNIRGLGRTKSGGKGKIHRDFNAVPYLAYWDIYKNYYANKQEERGYVIHQEDLSNEFMIIGAHISKNGVDVIGNMSDTQGNGTSVNIGNISTSEALGFKVTLQLMWNQQTTYYGEPDLSGFKIDIDGTEHLLSDLFTNITLIEGSPIHVGGNLYIWGYEATLPYGVYENQTWTINNTIVPNIETAGTGLPQLKEFPLENIDTMRQNILQDVGSNSAFMIDHNTIAPYGLGLDTLDGVDVSYKNTYCSANQEGLGIKTYQSDLFNNWISTEWIDGDNGINAITAVDTSTGEFTIDALYLANKVYVMMNRIAISGGTYDDWLDAVYTHKRRKSVESPIYHGSLIKELGFQEVISNSDTDVQGQNQPLGTLAGRGKLTDKHKGGKMRIKSNEPAVILGIISLTPRLDYSQGNKYSVNLKTMDDFHKPSMDGIGFQDLITDQMAFLDTEIDSQGNLTYYSAGKQPAWINYMTNVNITRGNFAKEEEMWMTLNRKYETGNNGIEDLTTYVDPNKYNQIFAQSSLDSQNFWVQIGLDIKARRKMSAKVIPNL